MIRRRNITRILVHALCWMLLFIFPFVASEKGSAKDANILAHAWLPLLEGAIIFYLNYLLLVERFVFRKKQFWLFILINAGLIILFRLDMPIYHFITGNDMYHLAGDELKQSDHEGKHSSDAFSLVKSLLALIIPTALALGARASELWRGVEMEKKESENKQLQTELINLKYQLQPHFFFNALNNIYSLVEISPESAQKAIHNLSKLMRYLLYDTNREQVDLSVEIGFLKKYIQLMEIRQSDDTTTVSHFPEVSPGTYTIAPLLLIPIVENAYKHGVSATGSSRINIDMRLTDNTLLFTSSNTNNPKNQSDPTSSGIGLENLRKRLQLIYQKNYVLSIEVKQNMYSLSLSINLNKPA